MALFCAADRRNSVSLLRLPFLGHVQVFSCEISSFCHLKYPHGCFPSHFYFLVVVVVLLICMLSVLFLDAFLLFLCSSQVIVLIYQYYFQYCSIHYLLLCLTHKVCLCHLLGVRFYSYSLSFLSFGPFVEVLLSFQEWSRVSNKRKSPGVYPFDEILAKELDFEKFSHSFEILVFLDFFFFISTC